MKRVNTARQIACPNCGHLKTKITCGRCNQNHKYRYRRCGCCDHKFKTSQARNSKNAEEHIVPYCELSALRQKEYLRGGANSKLTPTDVREIRSIYENSKYKDKDLCYRIGQRYDVEEQAIKNVISGRSWSFVA